MHLTDPNVIKGIRQQFGFDFKKNFGQNFLTSQAVLEDICDAADGSDGILEIGPGFGTLTNELAKRFQKVVAIEIDRRLPEVLNYTLAEHNNVTILQGDCMKMDLNEVIDREFSGMRVSVAANLPYYITTPIITGLLEKKLNLHKIVVMVQKEVAQRLCAEADSKDYGTISLLCSYYTEPQLVTNVPAGCFVPAPKVDSAVVSMKVLSEPKVKVMSEKAFFAVVKSGFSQRRKTLCNCLSSTFHLNKSVVAEVLQKAQIEQTRRGETLSIYEYATLTDTMICEGLIK